MSLLDARPTSAYTAFRVDRGPKVSPRYVWTPAVWLDNMGALQAHQRYPLGTADVFQWNGRAWQPLIRY